MLDKAFSPATVVTRRSGGAPPHEHRADLCVVGAGISGVSAAIEGAGLTAIGLLKRNARKL
jgi:hypothetical protein